MEWLSKKNQLSTVFISFGSENYLSKDQTIEIAKRLEACDVNFIWVARFPPGERVSIEVLPNGFLDRVKDRDDFGGMGSADSNFSTSEYQGFFESLWHEHHN
ncbi:UNVERIFIED_CONTAM: Flavonol 3-O-glucosyltransferase UGT89B1 [Sesamum calycinum]|uniref:Flavonol 3-O-glucosyltransferase UGT89B1 n=2 Tax=Sesamum TaxID=4181 RepID=A0AAW2R9Q6_9LAMI